MIASMKEAVGELVQLVKSGKIRSKSELEDFKKRLSKKYGLERLPRNSEILQALSPEERDKFLHILLKRPVRSASGVVVVAVMTPPANCPGKCIYCPQGRNAPKSYTGYEPATMRAKRLDYDAYSQVKYRLKQLEATGHSAEKVELILMGGTFPALPEDVQVSFVKRCFDALNGVDASSLKEAHRINERAKHRCVALTIETRPDYCMERHIDLMLEMGTTRVELGVQSLNEEVLELVRRGHGVEGVIKSTQLLKDAGLKVCYHIMPGLFQSPEEDIRMFRRLFSDEKFMPDMLKIYPVLVVEGTELYDMWKRGEFKPLSSEEAADLIAEIKRFVPPWCRIMRVQRDIPANLIVDGVKASNLRELAWKKASKKGIRCRCIRCREAGHRFYKDGIMPENPEIEVRKYRASGGTEFFISYEDVELDVLLGFCRLRFPYKPIRDELKEGTAIVRELKVFGSSLPLGKRSSLSFQHRGVGAMLLRMAEEIASENGFERLAVISAVGTREYYRKLGYELDGVYMIKKLDS